jgi:hypothetical protein
VLVLLMAGIYEVRILGGLGWHDIHTKCHDDPVRHSSVIKAIT